MTQSSQKKFSQSQIGKDEEVSDSVIGEAIKAIMILDYSKRPIKSSELLSQLSVKLRKGHLVSFWKKLADKLKTFDILLKELPDSKSMSSFILVAPDPDPQYLVRFMQKEERADRTLLIIVLSLIFMKDGMVVEDDLFRYLQELGITTSSSFLNDYFGDVQKKISKQFIEQMYISKTVVQGQENCELTWGPRANLEISKMDILNFVCKIGYGDRMKPSDWSSHFKKANE